LILHQENRDEPKKPSITLLQVKTNLTTSAELTKAILFDRKIFRKKQSKNPTQFDQTSPKTATRNNKEIPQPNEKNSPIVRENRPSGNTARGLEIMRQQ